LYPEGMHSEAAVEVLVVVAAVVVAEGLIG
jgi:hypothetical protein